MTNGPTYTYDMEAPLIEPPRTVVSLVPSLTESLFDLGLGERVVAVTDYCTRPEDKVRHLPKIGGTKRPRVAKIIDLRPDLVLANHEENRKEDVEALAAAGLRVWVTYPRTVPDVFNLLWNMMYTFDHTEMVERVRWLERHYDWVLGATKSREDRDGRLTRVFAPIWFDPLMTPTDDTYLSDLLRVCGGENVFARFGDGRYPRVEWADVEAAQPEVILLPSEPFAFGAEHVPLFKRLDVPAAKHDRIHLVDGALLTWHGTRIGYALQTIPPLLEVAP
ncbi:MAG: helical backbone metal receptor [Anaerolineae bacterium]|jgi:ABC-type Fe3+-hydroxamate transport system substrate-binding protein|nr:helical backbone metal receptor [Anaerolineae bacterium]